ncbi:tRNA-specific adenosine-34 deaminase subunit Tad3, putative [Talaromyces stipitatus ATCC 10500]|uniref:tRNA-specific adenosine-34 deaminase subunit Tad3, putative n=1 Tax=Talaromyces stipitatus (strain ATCC 10500 / CBS 375.48 / QM 6759 / NRRL 1006) TaxID=441959 RepID=B8MLB6_TALSN|nr:tRNA-specific adenosine-34 deaminase subunit Tad3, putative [Talaromyces stipitatus ATCC 10500]EED15031.1 tRNA-specific adenosine-34 deaminase subunit Tad3, putative [Talaromyces stipitatus ATCC 10500]
MPAMIISSPSSASFQAGACSPTHNSLFPSTAASTSSNYYNNSPSPFAAPAAVANSASSPAFRPHRHSLLSHSVEELRAALKNHTVAAPAASAASQDPASVPSGDHSRGCMSAGPDTLGGDSCQSLTNNVSSNATNVTTQPQTQQPPKAVPVPTVPSTANATSAQTNVTAISPSDVKGKRQLAETTEQPFASTANETDNSQHAGESEQSRLKRLRPPVPAVKLLPRQYELVHPNDLVILISSMIMELIQYNDTIPLQGGRLTRFHSRTPPKISVRDYLQRLTTHATLSPPILLSMVYYIDRLCALYPAFTVSSLTVHRFLITSATVASKGLSDSFWTNRTYARVGGITITELAMLELDFLWRVEWKIVPQPEVLVDYYLSLVERCEGYALEPEESSSSMEGLDIMKSSNHEDGPKITPLKGNIVSIPTVQETNPTFEFGDAYAVEIIQKCASQVTKVLDKAFPKDLSLPSTHLRRFVKWEFLPDAVKARIEGEKERSLVSVSTGHKEDGVEVSEQIVPPVTMFVLIPPPLPDVDQLRTLLEPFVASHIEQPPSANQPNGEAQEISSFPIHRITIPLQPPFNTHQAQTWSRTYWPTNFNAAAPRGMIAPPPKILGATKTSIAPRAGYYLSLAGEVAREAKRAGRGRGVGVVIVDPAIVASSHDNPERGGEEQGDNGVVAVAGDARYCAPGIVAKENLGDGYEADCEGGPEFHAIMRAVEMVATRRRDDKSITTTDSSAMIRKTSLTSLESYYLCRPASSTSFPLSSTSTETVTTAHTGQNANRILPRAAGGYLCTDLDIYITHEPCLACSMGMLLSRFRAITFPRRGRLVAGGLASMEIPQVTTENQDHSADVLATQKQNEAGNNVEGKPTQKRETYYGLHWRKELNWRAMCFEFVDDESDDLDYGKDGIEGIGNYHA